MKFRIISREREWSYVDYSHVLIPFQFKICERKIATNDIYSWDARAGSVSRTAVS